MEVQKKKQPYSLAILLLGIYLKNIKTLTWKKNMHLCSKQPKCTLTELDKEYVAYTVDPCTPWV